MFCQGCISKWLEQNHSCPACKLDRFIPQHINRNLRNQLELVDFSCKICDEVVSYSRLRHHSLECAHHLVTECPLESKTKFQEGQNFAAIREHVQTDCPSEKLNCRGCGYELYKNYAGRDALITTNKGHNCMRDCPESQMLVKNLIQI